MPTDIWDRSGTAACAGTPEGWCVIRRANSNTGVTSLTIRLLIPAAEKLTSRSVIASNVDFQCFSVETERPTLCGDHRDSAWVHILGVIPAQNKTIITKQTPGLT